MNFTQRSFALAAMLFFAGFLGCSKKDAADEAPKKLKKYPYENVHIKYKLTGSSVGTEEIFMADYGRYEAMYSDYTSSTEQGPLPKNQLVLTRVGDLFQVDFNLKKGQHVHIGLFDSLFALKENIPTLTEMRDKILEAGQFQAEGREMVNGYLCDRWRQAVGPVTIFLYNNLSLKKIVEGQKGEYTEEVAVSVDTAWKYDSTKFMLPDMQYEEMQMPGGGGQR